MGRKKQRNRRKLNPKPRTQRHIKPNNPNNHFFEIMLDHIPAGYAMNACLPGGKTTIVLQEFRSSEDGDLFISRLEGFPRQMLNCILHKYKHMIWESQIKNMIAIVEKDKSAKIYINTPARCKALIKTPRSMKAGTLISRNDLSDIQEMIFEGISIPKDAGVFIIFSAGWRRGLYFDLTPLAPNSPERDYDINLLLGSYYSYLLFRDRFRLSDNDWKNLFTNQWFPFISLSDNSINSILNYNTNGWNIDDLLPSIKDEILSDLPKKLKFWDNIESFKPHIKFLQEAYEQYKDGKNISCISILFPRIEGILRSFQTLIDEKKRATQKNLAETVMSDNVNPKHKMLSPLLPLKFNNYLSEVYFADFDKENNQLSRNTISHGVAEEKMFCLKGSTLGFLVLSQLAHYFSGIEKSK